MSSDARTVIRQEWYQVIFMALTVIGVFLWSRSESKADYRHMDAQIQAIHEEVKDFHGRLCDLEARVRK